MAAPSFTRPAQVRPGRPPPGHGTGPVMRNGLGRSTPFRRRERLRRALAHRRAGRPAADVVAAAGDRPARSRAPRRARAPRRWSPPPRGARPRRRARRPRPRRTRRAGARARRGGAAGSTARVRSSASGPAIRPRAKPPAPDDEERRGLREEGGELGCGPGRGASVKASACRAASASGVTEDRAAALGRRHGVGRAQVEGRRAGGSGRRAAARRCRARAARSQAAIGAIRRDRAAGAAASGSHRGRPGRPTPSRKAWTMRPRLSAIVARP